MSIKDSELILNSDGSVYHLHLKPKDLASTVITVGDPSASQKFQFRCPSRQPDGRN